MLYEKLKDYFVDDLLFDNTDVIFVLESPHTQEVKNGYPVAGKSGNDMSKVLFGLDESFGKLIYEQKIKHIGILNVSNYPLQHSAYKEEFRQNPKQRRYDKSGINPSVIKMMEDFKKRLEVHKDKKVVLCGNFAQSAFESVFNTDEFKTIFKVPHPSFNNWKKAKYQDVIAQLKNEIL